MKESKELESLQKRRSELIEEKTINLNRLGEIKIRLSAFSAKDLATVEAKSLLNEREEVARDIREIDLEMNQIASSIKKMREAKSVDGQSIICITSLVAAKIAMGGIVDIRQATEDAIAQFEQIRMTLSNR